MKKALVLNTLLIAVTGTLLFSVSTQAQTFETVFSDNQGQNPYANLIQGSDGSFYGTTQQGGTSGNGTVFKITASGTHTVLHSFTHTQGARPQAELVQGSDGHFYGTTERGGASNFGTVFQITASGTHTVLHSFNSTDGSNPRAGLVLGSDGNFYGATFQGGASSYGTVFKITSSGTHTLLHSFNFTNGRNPYARLVQGSDGNFYGTTSSGGASDNGTVFKITASGTHTVLHSFNSTRGRSPYARLVQGSDGNFYGTTSSGGASGNGTVFKITASGAHSLLRSFNYTHGSLLLAGLVLGSDGSFYGTTYQGGESGLGTVFKITTSGTYTLLHNFNFTNGSNPRAGLVQGRDGSFYGTTLLGGASGGGGTVYKITASGIHTLLYSFDGISAAYPRCTPTFGNDGYLYGTADAMVVWRMDVGPNPVFTTLHSQGGAVPNAGVTGSGIPAGAVWEELGVPSINDARHIAVYGGWRVGVSRGGGIFRGDAGVVGLHLTIPIGASLPGVPQVVIGGLNEPLLGADGSILVVARLSNAPGATSAVTPASNSALLLDADGPGSGAAVVVARKGAAAPGVAGATISTFDSVALGNGAVGILGRVLTSGSVSNSRDSCLWVHDRCTSKTTLALREGQALLGSNLSVLSALVARSGAGGQGRGVVSDGVMDQMAVRVTLSDGSSAIGAVAEDGTVAWSYLSDFPAPGYGSRGKWKSLGLPGQNTVGALTFVGEVRGGQATRGNNVAIFTEDDTTLALTRRLSKGNVAPGGRGAVFAGFKDPVNGTGGAFAFTGSLARTSQAKNDGVWYHDGSELSLVAREEAYAPGTDVGTRWSSFTSVALPDRRAPLFYATLKVGPGGVSAGSDTGIWAVDSLGQVKKVIQEGDAFGSSTVRSFKALLPLTGSPAQTRSFNNNGEVVMQVTDATGATHLLHVAVP